MKNTTKSHPRSTRMLFASLALSMVALLAGCDQVASVAEPTPKMVPSAQHMQAWRTKRDGHQWQYTSFKVEDLKCRNLSADEKALAGRKINTGKSFDEFFETIIACSYSVQAERQKHSYPDQTETLKRQVDEEQWWIGRTDKPEERHWRGSMPFPGKPI